MNAPLLRLASSAVRGWTRLYTCRLPPEIAEGRCAEIKSDLWELQQDPQGGRGLTPALHIFARLVSGIPDDLCWRGDHATSADSLLFRRTLSLMVAAALFLFGLWRIPVSTTEVGGRRQVRECANAYDRAETRAELRLQLIHCAGAFFVFRADGDASRD